ncbi:MAG: fumarylacetoacetase [Pseudomonadota bacterium]
MGVRIGRLDETHDPARRSWIGSANARGTDFPIQNLPFGVFSHPGDAVRHVGVAIGDEILNVTLLEAAGLLRLADTPVFRAGTLNPFMALPPPQWSTARRIIAELLTEGVETLRASSLSATAILPRSTATMHMPFAVADFTDFYSSREHASRFGTMFRGADRALPPNWLHMPIAYNGRASTVVVSGTSVRRPLGQLKRPDEAAPHLAPSQKLDYELELGAVIGAPSAMGRKVSTTEAYEMIFGFVLLNDWSARDIQLFEYQPLGPFQSKAFATTISPWVVTRDALEPFRVAAPERQIPLLPYLHEPAHTHYDIGLKVAIGAQGNAPQEVSANNARLLYYSASQQIAHHTLCGCAMRTGDLLGSGTISGSAPGTEGCLLEQTQNGEAPIALGSQTRTFLEDGDTVTLTGVCEGDYRIGFGTCAGTVTSALRADR